MTGLRKLVQEIAKRCPGGVLPSSYLVIDLETSGLNWSRKVNPDVVVQLGYAAVSKRQLVTNAAFLIKRPAGTMSAEASAVNGITDEMLDKQGAEPAEIYPKLVKLMELYRSSDCMHVGHNIVGFDAPFLAADLERHGIGLKFRSNEFLDTGMMYKAAQLRTYPSPQEDLTRFFARIRDTRSRVRWKLTLAIEQLKLDVKHGIDLTKAHDAAFDCRMTHLLLEELRRLAEVTS